MNLKIYYEDPETVTNMITQACAELDPMDDDQTALQKLYLLQQLNDAAKLRIIQNNEKPDT